MADISGGGGGGDAYTYVQDSQPGGAEEGETWYDTGSNAAYVYDGASWIEQTVVDRSQLSGVGGADHHTRYSDGEARSAVRTNTGQIDSYGGSQQLTGSSATDPWSVTFGNGDGLQVHDQISVTVTENDGTSDNKNPVVEEIVVVDPDGNETTVWSGSFGGYTLSDGETWNNTVDCNEAAGDRIRMKGSLTNDTYSADFTVDMRPSYHV